MIRIFDKHGNIKTATTGGGGGAAVWGGITGTLSDQSDLQAELDLKAPKNNPVFTGTVSGITKAMVGLGNVDNTSDATKNAAVVTLTNKSISATNNTITGLSNTNLNGSAGISDANISSSAYWNAKQDALTPGVDYLTPTGDGSGLTGLTKGQVGLENVDNTSDLNKPISTATQTALDGKENTITATTSTDYYRGDKTFQPLNKAAVGLGNVDNTSDATKNAASATLTNKTLTAPVINSPTGIVKGDVGLGNVDNTSNATERAASATLTNKTMSGTNNTFSNISADSTIDGTTNKVFTAVEKTKLSIARTTPVKDVTDSAGVTGTLTETIVTSLSVPAGTFAQGDIMKVSSFDQKLLSAGTLQIKYYVNTVNSLSGAQAIFLYSSATTLKSIGTSREYFLKPSTVIYGHSATANNVIITEAGTANTPLSLTFNYTGAFFIIKTFVLGNTGDTAIGKSFRVEKI